jgi:hypothetical protein
MSKNRKFRRKISDAADDDEDPGTMAVPPGSLAARQKEKSRSAAGKTLLSFGDDEEASAAAPRKQTGKIKHSGVRTAAITSTEARVTTQVSGPGKEVAAVICFGYGVIGISSYLQGSAERVNDLHFYV